MESSQPEAENNLRQTLAIKTLANSEGIKVNKKEIEDKFKEISVKLSNEKNIDPQKLRKAIEQDLLKDKVFIWLEDNNTVNLVEETSKNTTDKSAAKENSSKSKSKKEKK